MKINEKSDDAMRMQSSQVVADWHEGDLLLVQVLAAVRVASEDGENPDVVPTGTQLVGVWEADQPMEEDRCAVSINGTTWTFDREDVALSRLDRACIPWKEQARIAAEHLALAKTAERQGKDEEARQHYARALVELEASGNVESEMAPDRLSYAFLLTRADRISDAIAQMERAARACEAAATVHPLYGKDVNEAELAAHALIALGRTVLLAPDLDPVYRQRTLRQTALRLLAMNKLVKKRYETKVTLLLTTAELWDALGETREAQFYLDQADTFYQQQLAIMAGWPTIEPITTQLQRVKAIIGKAQRERTMKFQLIAATADDLEVLLSALQEQLPGVRVTRGVTAERPVKSTRAGVRYTAHISWTTTVGVDAAKPEKQGGTGRRRTSL